MLLVGRIVRMMLLVIKQDGRTSDLTVGDIWKAHTLQCYLVDWRYLLSLELVTLDGWGAVRRRSATVVGVEL